MQWAGPPCSLSKITLQLFSLGAYQLGDDGGSARRRPPRCRLPEVCNFEQILWAEPADNDRAELS
jgi:hypothetical protein